MLGLLPHDWTLDRICLARVICEKRASARITQWFLQRKERLSSFFTKANEDGLDEHSFKILKNFEVRIGKGIDEGEDTIFSKEELHEMHKFQKEHNINLETT